MKIAIFGMKYYNYTESISYALQQLGHNVLMAENNERNRKNLEQKEQLVKFKPDLFINFCGNYFEDTIDEEFLKKLSSCKKILMYADSISFVGKVEQHFSLYDKIFVFEPSDVVLMKNKYNIDALVSTASVAEEIHCQNYGDVEKIYDISFVGVMTEERIEFFDEIAEFAYNNGYKMICYGHFWHDKHWWQSFFSKRKFARKHPFLSKFAVNKYLEPKDAALMYKKSKICLNKHINRHQGLNYRTFEIMANENFILCDERIQANDYGLVNGNNIIFYKNADDCKSKIKYYLEHKSEREKIALNGSVLIKNNYTTRKAMEKILKSIFG